MSIEAFDQQINEIKLSLEELKKETSIEQKNKKSDAAKEKINKTKEDINKRLAELNALWDETSLEEAKKLEEKLVALNTFSSEITSLEVEVKNNNNDNTNTPDNKEKWWFGRQREGVTSSQEWKDNTWTNVWRVAMWVWAVSVTWRWIKKLFGIWKDKEKKDWDKTEKTSRWKKALLRWAWIWWWLLVWKNRDSIKDFLWFWNKLSFDDSLIQAESELETISESEKINVDRWKITYDPVSKQVKSYDLATAINKNWKKVEGLDIKFSDYKQLIHAANIVNYIKHNFKWRSKTDTPFKTKSLTWDIYFETKDWTKEIISGGIFSSLASICPDVLNGLFTDRNNKDIFLAYLNKLWIWKEWTPNQPDDKWDKIQKAVNDVVTTIIATPTEFDPLWNERNAVIAEKIDPKWEQYLIKSRWNPSNETKINLKTDSNWNIISWQIEWLNSIFNSLEELVRVANLTNKIKYQYRWKCGDNKEPFSYKSLFTTLYHPWLYVYNDWIIPDRVCIWSNLETLTPVLYKWREDYVKYLNWLKKDGKSRWVKSWV